MKASAQGPQHRGPQHRDPQPQSAFDPSENLNKETLNACHREATGTHFYETLSSQGEGARSHEKKVASNIHSEHAEIRGKA